MTQASVAAFCGYCLRTVQHWEAGTRIPHKATQEAILRKIEMNDPVLAQQGEISTTPENHV